MQVRIDYTNLAVSVYTNSDMLVKIRPNTVKVDEPTYEQLRKANTQHEIVFVYPSIMRMKNELGVLANLPGKKRVVVDGKVINIDDYITYDTAKQRECLKTPNGATLRQYQQQLVDFILERKRVGLFVDMGLGKTLATLATVNELFKNNHISKDKPVLVIAPKMVALDTWAREVSKWGYDMDVLVNIGLTKKKRDELFKQMKKVTKPTIVTTNPEQLKNILEVFSASDFDAIIVDELSLFKSAETKRFEMMTMLGRQSKYFIGLTGTPAPNSLLDIWSQLVIVDEKVKYDLGYSYFQYRSHFFRPGITDPRTGVVYSWVLTPGAEDAIYQKVEPYVISLKGNNLVDIPDVTYTNDFVRMDEKSKRIYTYLDKEIREEVKALERGERVAVDTGENDVDVANTAILKSKLIQLATGAMYDKDSTQKDRKYTVFHDAKIERLKEMVMTATSPLLVFYNFVSDLERIKKAVPNAVVLNTKDKNVDNVIKKWNAGEIPVLLANPRSTGHGLNLQEGGHIIIWFSLTWNNEIYRQANKRLHRPGQQHPVQIIHLVTKDTADEEIIPRIDNKEETQQGLLDALKIENY